LNIGLIAENVTTWKGFGFSVALSVIAIVAFLGAHNWNASLPAVVSFLPMAFYFAAQSQQNNLKQIKALKARIEQLEARTGAA